MRWCKKKKPCRNPSWDTAINILSHRSCFFFANFLYKKDSQTLVRPNISPTALSQNFYLKTCFLAVRKILIDMIKQSKNCQGITDFHTPRHRSETRCIITFIHPHRYVKGYQCWKAEGVNFANCHPTKDTCRCLCWKSCLTPHRWLNIITGLRQMRASWYLTWQGLILWNVFVYDYK